MPSPSLIPSTACSIVARFDSCTRGQAVRVTHVKRTCACRRAAGMARARAWRISARMSAARHGGRTWRAACGVSTTHTAGFARLYATSRASQSRMCGDDDGSCAPARVAGGQVSGGAGRASQAVLQLYSRPDWPGDHEAQRRRTGARRVTHLVQYNIIRVPRLQARRTGRQRRRTGEAEQWDCTVPGRPRRRATQAGHALPARTCSSSGRCGSTGTKRRPCELRSAKSASDPDTNSSPAPGW